MDMSSSLYKAKIFQLKTKQIAAEQFKSFVILKRLMITNDQHLSEFKHRISLLYPKPVYDSSLIKNYIHFKQPINTCCNQELFNNRLLTYQIKKSLEKSISNTNQHFTKTENINSQFKDHVEPNYYTYTPLKKVGKFHNSIKLAVVPPNGFRLKQVSIQFEALNGILYGKSSNTSSEPSSFNVDNFKLYHGVQMKYIPFQIVEKNFSKIAKSSNVLFHNILENPHENVFKRQEIINDKKQMFTNMNLRKMQKPYSSRFSPIKSYHKNAEKIAKTFSNKKDKNDYISIHMILSTSTETCATDMIELIESEIEDMIIEIVLVSNEVRLIKERNELCLHDPDNSKNKITKNSDTKRPVIFPNKELHKTISREINHTYFENISNIFDSDDVECMAGETNEIKLAITYTELYIFLSRQILERSSSGNQRYSDKKSLNSKIIEYSGNFGFVDGIFIEKEYVRTISDDFHSDIEPRESFKALSHMYNLKMLVTKSTLFEIRSENSDWLDEIIKVRSLSSNSSSKVSSDPTLEPVDHILFNAFTKKIMSEVIRKNISRKSYMKVENDVNNKNEKN